MNLLLSLALVPMLLVPAASQPVVGFYIGGEG